MDGRKGNGGPRPGAGRKPKTDVQALVEQLNPLEPLALKKLEEAIQQGKPWAIKLFFEYRYGKPKQEYAATITPLPWGNLPPWMDATE